MHFTHDLRFSENKNSEKIQSEKRVLLLDNVEEKLIIGSNNQDFNLFKKVGGKQFCQRERAMTREACFYFDDGRTTDVETDSLNIKKEGRPGRTD